MTELDAKMQFATLLVEHPKDALQIAKRIVGPEVAASRPMFVIKIAEDWPFDDLVMAEVARLKLLPTPKEIIEKEVLEIARNEYVDPQDRVKAYELVAKIGGHIVIKNVTKDTGKSDDRLTELAAMVMGDAEYSKPKEAVD